MWAMIKKVSEENRTYFFPINYGFTVNGTPFA